MSARFQECLEFVLKWEGGKDDDPDDRGGRTAFGITQAEYDSWRRANGIATQDVWSISQIEVRSIYFANYWQVMNCDNHTAPFDLCVFDAAVNNGVGKAKVWRLKAKAIWYVSGAGDIKKLCKIFLDLRESFYRSIAKGTQAKFLRGWLNRVADLRRVVS